jgi:glucuronoarabinoxylan endo-1,4-beta-xylanase
MLTASKQMFVTVTLLKFCFGSFLHRLVWEARPHMKSHRFAITFITAMIILAAGSYVSLADDIVTFQAESASALGSDWAVSNSASPAYITILTDGAGSNRGSAARVASYSVTFPSAGTYQLYARVLVGPGGFNDDSLFYGNGFGVKNPTNSADWIFVNNLANSRGFINPTDVVTGGGTAGNGVWKWINLSLFAPGATFAVTSGNLMQTFQIAARENGLDMDAFAFGLNYYTYTVSDLDSGIDGTPPSAGTSVINWTNLLQRMDGFGGGVVFLDVPDPVSNANMDTLYKTNGSNLGLTLLRVRIDPNTNWANALTDAQRAVTRGARVLATPWTPPYSMKDNGVALAGSLLPSQYASYANYLNNFAGYLKANGAPLAAVSVQNEPDYALTFESCVWTSSQFLSFFRTNAAAITNAPVMMPESFHFDQTLSDATLNDAVAVTNVAYVGGHLYGATIADYPLAHSKGKPTWMTEWLVNDQTIDSAISTAQQIHDCINIGNMSAYIWWKVMSNTNGLLNAAGTPQKRGFVMAQFSRFVRPGFNRIAVSYSGSILTTAYRDTNSGAFAIVAINPTGIPLTPVFNFTNFPAVVAVVPWITSPDVSLAVQSSVPVSGGSFSYTLPGLSVVTFVAQTNFPPTFTTIANQTINPGATLNLTNVVSDADLPAQSLTFSLLTAPTNATLTTLNSTNTRFIWRPLISQADSTNTIKVKVTDNGSPNLSATNSFIITVNPVGQPVLSSITVGGGQITLMGTGLVGPDYALLTSTNLLNWQTLFTTNPTVMPVSFVDTNLSDTARFYRLQLGP